MNNLTTSAMEPGEIPSSNDESANARARAVEHVNLSVHMLDRERDRAPIRHAPRPQHPPPVKFCEKYFIGNSCVGGCFKSHGGDRDIETYRRTREFGSCKYGSQCHNNVLLCPWHHNTHTGDSVRILQVLQRKQTCIDELTRDNAALTKDVQAAHSRVKHADAQIETLRAEKAKLAAQYEGAIIATTALMEEKLRLDEHIRMLANMMREKDTSAAAKIEDFQQQLSILKGVLQLHNQYWR